MQLRAAAALIAMTVATAGCDLELINPNSPTEATVLSNQDELLGLAVGLQGQWAGSVRYFALPSALVTDEWGPRARALANDRTLFAGEPDPTFLAVAEPYRATFQIMRTANNLLANAPTVIDGAGLQTGVIALAKLHKAMALGQAIQIYEEMPVELATEGSPAESREVVLDTVIALLESARSDLQGVSDADLAGFRSRVLDPGIDLRSSIDAMLARYYLIDGQYDAALAAAERADSENASVYTYAGNEMNPIYQYSIALDYVWPLEELALEAEAGDQRVSFWTDPTVVDEQDAATLISPAEYTDRYDVYPLYQPDEVTLIKAEVHARQGNLVAALAEINDVRTQCDEGVADPAPCLTPLTLLDVPTQDAMLAQIAYERRYELFLTGLRWEDLRRLGEFTGETPKVDFLPFPLRECDTNPNLEC